MYCTHCAKKINEAKLERKNPTLAMSEDINEATTVAYVCPRCGHLVHDDLEEDEVKSLARAAHAQIQRGRNFFASGMGMVSTGAILLAIAILFFFLAKKPSNKYELVVNCAEFYVFLVLGILSIGLLGFGGYLVAKGIARQRSNTSLLRDINNRTFIQ